MEEAIQELVVDEENLPPTCSCGMSLTQKLERRYEEGSVSVDELMAISREYDASHGHLPPWVVLVRILDEDRKDRIGMVHMDRMNDTCEINMDVHVPKGNRPIDTTMERRVLLELVEGYRVPHIIRDHQTLTGIEEQRAHKE